MSPLDLIAPHDGTLQELYLSGAEAAAAKKAAADLPSWDLTHRQLCDIELLLSGGFSPLTGFMNRADYTGVVDNMRLASGALWPMPITLDVTRAFAEPLSEGDTVALRDPEGVLIALLDIGDIWEPDKAAEARGVFKTTDEAHAGVRYLMRA